MEASSRIFARNLPPNLSEKDFRKHIAQRFPSSITDIKLFPQRRIGYVGLRTPEDAAAAVKYFNKTFIRMSRIQVEPASAPPPSTNRTARPVAKISGAVAQAEDIDDRPAKRQRRNEDETLHTTGLEEPVNPADQSKASLQNEAGHQDEVSTGNGAEGDGTAQSAPVDDLDWMRSRTSRTLGLVEDDEEDADVGLKDQDKKDTSGSHPQPATRPEQVPTPPPEKEEDDVEAHEAPEIMTIRGSGRLFLRNLPYTVVGEDLRQILEQKGPLQEVHVPVDPKTGTAKGFAFVQFQDAEDAIAAYKDLDGTTFQGRLLHVLPASAKRENKLDEIAMSKLPVKKQKMLEKKAQASSSTFNWNSLYMNADAVMSSIADRLGVSKSELFDPTSSDAGVKQAQAETHVIQETRAYFEENGVDLNSFARKERGDTAILVKNFPYGTTVDDLKSLFGEAGEVSRLLLPPSGTIAIVEFSHKAQARAASASFSYRKYKDSVLFLEKAPKDVFQGHGSAVALSKSAKSQVPASEPAKLSTSELLQPEAQEGNAETSTLYVRNLNFATTNERLEQTFKPLDGFLSARVKTKTDAKKPGQVLSMGFGFVEFSTSAQAQAALKAIDGYSLDGHSLVVKASHRGHDAAEARRKEDEAKKQRARKSKLIIKNLPFEASKKDVRALFKTYGQLRSVRVPNKFDGSRKGYAFAEFTTPKEAENAMDTLRNTHLLGRRLVIDFAEGDAEDAEAELEKMQQKVDRQTSSVALQRLTAASERKKFVIGDSEQADG